MGMDAKAICSGLCTFRKVAVPTNVSSTPAVMLAPAEKHMDYSFFDELFFPGPSLPIQYTHTGKGKQYTGADRAFFRDVLRMTSADAGYGANADIPAPFDSENRLGYVRV
jgi:hypothetical protein